MKRKLQYLIWFFCLIVIIQVGWVQFRLYQLERKQQQQKSDQKAQTVQQRKQAQKNLAQVPEPVIEEKLPKGGKLLMEKEIKDNRLNLKITASSDQKIEKADLRIFYDPNNLKIVNAENNGVFQWSSEQGWEAGEFVLTEVVFQIISSEKGNIRFDFSKESRLDCNLWNEKGMDILEVVEEK